MAKFNRSFIRQLFMLTMGFVLISQAIHLVTDYLAYPTVQTVNILSSRRPMSVTLCDKNYDQLMNFVQKSECVLVSKDLKSNFDVRLQHPMLSRKAGLYCATYLSRLSPSLNKNQINTSLLKDVWMYTRTRIGFTAVHSPLSPPQLLSSLIESGCSAEIDVAVTSLFLMPSPYDTRCREYDEKAEIRSRDDCLLQCTNRFNLTDLYVEENNFYKAMPSQVNRTGNSKRICSVQCLKKCDIDHYSFTASYIVSNARMCYFLNLKMNVRYMYKQLELVLQITHVPEFTSALLFVQIGGLVGLWFGRSVNAIFKATVQKIYVVRIHLTKLIWLSYSLTSFYQIVLAVVDYFNFKTITSTFFDNNYESDGIFPSLEFCFPKLVIDSLDFDDSGNASELFKKYETMAWNGSANSITKLTWIDDDIRKTFRFDYERKGIKEVHFELNWIFPYPLNSWFLDVKQSFSLILLFQLVTGPTDFDVRVKQQTFELMPPPYDTGCRDYGKDFNSNVNYSGRYGCESVCLNNFFKARFNCSSHYSHFYKIGNQGIVERLKRIENWDYCDQEEFRLGEDLIKTGLIKDCMRSCKPSCTDYQYKVRSHPVKQKNPDNIVRIRLRFDDGFVLKFVSMPKMTSFDFFYEVGGIVSLWFGWDIVGLICGAWKRYVGSIAYLLK